jgi:hypothetical protein
LTFSEYQVVSREYLKEGSALTCGSWTAAKWLCDKLAAEEGSTMDIVHCYDAINTFNVWYPSYLKRCLNRDSQLPIVTALVYIEKAKEISQDEFKEEINKGLKNHEITEPPKIKKITLEERIRKERPPPRIRGMESSQP